MERGIKRCLNGPDCPRFRLSVRACVRRWVAPPPRWPRPPAAARSRLRSPGQQERSLPVAPGRALTPGPGPEHPAQGAAPASRLLLGQSRRVRALQGRGGAQRAERVQYRQHRCPRPKLRHGVSGGEPGDSPSWGCPSRATPTVTAAALGAYLSALKPYSGLGGFVRLRRSWVFKVLVSQGS